MLMPRIIGETLLNNFFGNAIFNCFGMADFMQCNIKDSGQAYEVEIQMPGVQKEDIKVEIEDGYLTISASTNQMIYEENEKEQYICQECHSGSCSRSFYVGYGITQNEIKMNYSNETLLLTVPKKE